MLDDITVTDPDAKYDVTAPTPSLRRTVRGGDKLTGVSPELLSHWNNLHDEFSAAGITPEIKSGFRTAAQQNALFKNPATAARTKGNDGYVNISPHQRGTALDISFNAAQRNQGRAIIANYAKRTGLHVPSDEPWHIALPQNKGAVVDPDSKYDIAPDATEPDTDPDAKYNVASASTTATAPTPLTPNDVEWHFGTAGDPSKLTPRARKVLADAVTEDARKKSLYGGIEQPNADYQSTMRSRAGIGQRVSQPSQQPKPQPATTAATDAYGNPTPFGALRNIITAPDTARSTARAQIESERASEGTVARTIRTARSVLSPAAIDLLTASNPNTQLNDEVEKRVAAQQFHTTHADEIDNLASKYAYEIRGFSKQQVNKWLDEMSYRTKSALTSSVAGAVRPFSPDTYDKLRITAAAMAQAAENGGADRSTLSKFTQQTAAGFISSVPELTAMSLGVPASVAFGAGGALSEAGQGGSPTDIARESAVGATTGVLFETPMPGTSRLARTIQRAGLVGAGSTAAELAAGHPLRESAISGVTNAVMAGAPELAGAHSYPDLFKRGPEGVVTGPTEIPAAYSADNAAAEQLLKTGAVKAGVTPESIAAATQAPVPRTAPAIRQPLTTALYVPSTHDNGQISMMVEGADGGRTRKFFNSQAEADEFTAQRTGAPGQPTTAHGPPDLDPARFSDSERQTVEQILARTNATHDSSVLTKEGELVTTPIGLTPAKRGERGAIGEPPESGPKIPGVKVGAAADLEDAQDLGMVDSAPSTFNPQLSVRMADALSHADQYAANLKEGRAQLDPLRQAVTAVHADFANAPQSEIVNWLTRNRPDLTNEYTDHEIAQAVRREYTDRAEARSLPKGVQDLTDIGSMMRIDKGVDPNERLVAAGFDPKLIPTIAKNMYKLETGTIVPKELLQNAVDAVRSIPNAATTGKVHLSVDTNTKTFSIGDNGVGMLPDVVDNQFTDLGGTLKQSLESSGGFGIAKGAMFYNAESLHVDTTARDPKTGKHIRTIVDGSGDDWLDPKRGLRVTSSEVPASHTTGTDITIRLKPDAAMDPYSTKRFLINFAKRQKVPFSLRIDIDGKTFGSNKGFDDQGDEKIRTLQVQGANLDVYKPSKMPSWETNSVTVHLLNHGLPQGELQISLEQAAKIPSEMTVNVRSTGRPEAEDYPWLPSREGVRGEAEKAITKYIKTDMAAEAIRAKNDLYTSTMREAPRVKGTDYRVVDTDGNIPRALLDRMASDAGIRQLSTHLDSALARISQVLSRSHRGFSADLYTDFEFGGIGLGRDYYGVNIVGAHVGADAGYSILINPLNIIESADQITGHKHRLVHVPEGTIDHNLEISEALKRSAEYEPLQSPNIEDYRVTKDEVDENGTTTYKVFPKDTPSDLADKADWAARRIIATSTHEITHNVERGHGESFSSELTANLGLVYGALDQELTALKELFSAHDYATFKYLRDLHDEVQRSFQSGEDIFANIRNTDAARPTESENSQDRIGSGEQADAKSASNLSAGRSASSVSLAEGAESGRIEHPTDPKLSGTREGLSPSGKTTYVKTDAGEIRAPRTTTVSQTPKQLQTALEDVQRASRKVRSDYDAIARHTARRQGLALANEDVTRNYFNRLRSFVRTNMPAKLDLVDQAESAAFSHQYAKATVLAESAFTGIHDYVNKLGATNLALNYAIRSGDIDSLQRGPWKAALDEARKRLGETGPPISGGSVTFDPKVHPKGGYADHAKIAYVMEPFVDAARTEFARLVNVGKLKADQFASYMRDWMQSTLETDDFKKWHRLNRDSAYGAVLNSVRSQVYDPKLQGFRTVPNTASPYVDPTPLNFAIGATDRETARDIRREVSGDQNKQLATGNTLAANGRRAVKDPTAQSAIYFYNAVGGDVAKLRSYLTNKDVRLDPYRSALQKALNLSPAEMEWAVKLRDAYDALGDYSRSLGTINHVRDNYTNKLYVTEKPAKNFVQSDAYRSGLSKSTGHSKPVTYANALDAVLGLDANGNEVSATGKKLASTSAFDNFQILNSEMARANTNAKFREAMQRTGLGSEVPASHIPEGYSALEGMDRDIPIPTHESLTAPKGTFKWNQPNEDGAMVLHKRFVVPEGIVKGLAALTDADFAKRIGLLRKLDKYQGIVKTIDLSYSAFHHLALASQILYQSKYGFDLVRNARQLREWAKSGEMDKLEQDFTRHTGMTTRVESNQDILRDLTSGDDVLARAMNLPGIKQVAAGSKMSTDFLFDKIQRNLKVIDYANKSAKWIREHPKATDRELIEAKRSIASEINAAYGGLNWRALGVTRSQLSLLRLILLSPDWTLSNGILLGKAVSGGPGGKAAKSHLITAAVGSALLTEGLSYALHGRSTTNNERGHEFELELSPGVYVSLFRGGISDIAKMYQLIHDVGPMRGVSQFASNKLAPLPRTAVGVISNYQLGRPILVPFNPSQSWMHNTYDQLVRTGSLLAPALPLPIGASQTAAYLRRGNATVAGTAAIASGLARSTSGKGARTPAEKYMAQLSDRKGHDIYDDAQDAHYTQRRGLIDAIRSKGVKTVAPQVRELAQQGKLGPQDVTTIRDDSKLTPFQERFKHINDLNDALNIWERMTPTEQHDTRAILGAKLQHTIPGKSAEEKQKILDHLRRIGLAPAAKVSANRVPVRAPGQSDLSYRASLKNYLHPSESANRLAQILNA